MSVGKDEDILIYTVHIKSFLEIHNLVIKGYKEFRTPEGTARMPRIYFVYHSQDIPSYLYYELLQIMRLCHKPLLFYIRQM